MQLINTSQTGPKKVDLNMIIIIQLSQFFSLCMGVLFPMCGGFFSSFSLCMVGFVCVYGGVRLCVCGGGGLFPVYGGSFPCVWSSLLYVWLFTGSSPCVWGSFTRLCSPTTVLTLYYIKT